MGKKINNDINDQTVSHQYSLLIRLKQKTDQQENWAIRWIYK